MSKRSILIFVDDNYEDLELWYPKLRLEEAGFRAVVAGERAGARYAGKHGYPCVSDVAISDVTAKQASGVLLVGGWAPDRLRRNEHVLSVVAQMHADQKMIASICHGPWIAISARVVQGLTYTSTPGIKDDLINAGAEWVDRPAVVDGHHISARRPPDLPDFAKAMLSFLN